MFEIKSKEVRQMNERERKVFEMGLRNKISYKEEERNRTIKEAAIEDVLMQLEIIMLASQSQDPEVLKRGLSYYFLTQKIIEEMEIKYDEIDPSEEEIKSLGNEIIQKLPAPVPNVLIVIEENSGEEPGEMSKLFENNPN